MVKTSGQLASGSRPIKGCASDRKLGARAVREGSVCINWAGFKAPVAIGQVVLLWDRTIRGRMPYRGGAGTALEAHWRAGLATDCLCDLGFWDIPEC